jgi:hypothetical protein
MKSRYEYLNNAAERRSLAIVRGVAGALVAVALLASAVTVQPIQPAPSVAVEFAASASAVDIEAALYDGPEAGEPLAAARAAARPSSDEFGGFDQLYPHAYMGEPGVLG